MQLQHSRGVCHIAFVLISFACTTTIQAQTKAQTQTEANQSKPEQTNPEQTELGKVEPTKEQLFARFVESLSGNTLVGTFTIDGDKDSKRREERYEIKRVTKADQGDYWNIFARMKYGKTDLTFPFPVEVKWAGSTPVITVDELKLIGMGDAFDARIVISDGKYAGTWRHGKFGGLMFGRIEKTIKEAKKTEKKDPKEKEALKPTSSDG